MSRLKDFLKHRLSVKHRIKLRNFIQDFKTFPCGNNLEKLAKIYGTDKQGAHNYMQHYETHFMKFKYKKFNLLEIGAGGFENPHNGIGALRMWKRYFRKASVFSIDLFDKSLLCENRIHIFKGDQKDKDFMEKVAHKIGGLDIIIDDACHINKVVTDTFIQLFPKMNNGGIYVVEDTQVSYRSEFGGDNSNLNNPDTTMNFFKSLTDSINYQEIDNSHSSLSFLGRHIISMHFYHNLIFIYKGQNDEKSNLINNYSNENLQI
jgi:hypothetical protein